MENIKEDKGSLRGCRGGENTDTSLCNSVTLQKKPKLFAGCKRFFLYFCIFNLKEEFAHD
jgi:hypothetical protein